MDEVACEGARLYSCGSFTEARAFLERQMRSGLSGGERLWLMLFAVYEESGNRNLFDKLAQDFAIRFNTSKPAWRGPSAPPVHAMQITSGNPSVSLTGRISSESAPQFDRLRVLADRKGSLQIDFSKLKGMDPAGCTMLLAFLHEVRKRGDDSLITGDNSMLHALAKATQLGARDVPDALWLLRLELLQWHGRQEEFERVGRDYADTFSVTPPSFESIVRGGTVPRSALEMPAAQLATIAAPVEIEGFSHSFFEELENFAVTRSLVQVNLSGLKRIDFWATARLLGIATQLKTAGKCLELLGPNILVAEWLEAMGLSTVVRIVPRRL